MDLITTTKAAKFQETESEPPPPPPPPTQPSKLADHYTPKPLSVSNGVLKRHHLHPHPNLTSPAVVVTYKECLKNHAANLGGHALDGCGEFMPSPSATPADPTSLKCAACGCHRNFHHREPEEGIHTIDYHHHHHHQQQQPAAAVARGRSPNSPSPPPLSSSYFPSAPHMLLALSAGLSGPIDNHLTGVNTTPATVMTINPNGRKRFRSKFSQEQKAKMYAFSERLAWKMQKRDEELVEEFCNEVGVEKSVLKVWMHNNKHTFGKRDFNSSRSSLDTNNHNHSLQNDISGHVAINGSSSSS